MSRLDEFERLLQDRAPDVAAGLTSGRPRDAICNALSDVVRHPPDDLVAWWSHWDVRPGIQRPVHILPGLQFLSLSSSLNDYRRQRQNALDLAEVEDRLELEVVWSVDWVPIFFIGSGGTVVADCDPDGAGGLRVVYPDIVGQNGYGGLIASSVEAYVANATKWIEQSGARFDAESEQWVPLQSWIRTDLAERFLTGL